MLWRLCLILSSLFAWGEGALAASPEAVILIYHRFGEDDIPATNTPLGLFAAQIDWLVGAGAHFASLDAIVAARKSGRDLPDFTVAITADDAYQSVADHAWPLLRSRGIPLSLFVASDGVDQHQDRLLDWPAIRALAKQGVTIGHHGAAHGHLAALALADARADIERASGRFQTELGMVPKLFAYPYGEYSKDLMTLVRDIGFAAGFAQFSSVVGMAEDDFALPRFAINAQYGEIARFKLLARAKALPVASFHPDDPWANPPAIHLTLSRSVAGLARLACYASIGDKALPLAINGLEVTMKTPTFPSGRSRINCTLPGPDGRWYWFGRAFFVR